MEMAGVSQYLPASQQTGQSLEKHCHSGLTISRLEEDQENKNTSFSCSNVPIRGKIKIIQNQIQFWNTRITPAILLKTGLLLNKLKVVPKWVRWQVAGITEKISLRGDRVTSSDCCSYVLGLRVGHVADSLLLPRFHLNKCVVWATQFLLLSSQ